MNDRERIEREVGRRHVGISEDGRRAVVRGAPMSDRYAQKLTGVQVLGPLFFNLALDGCEEGFGSKE